MHTNYFAELLAKKLESKTDSTVSKLQVKDTRIFVNITTTVKLPASERKEFSNELKDKPVIVEEVDINKGYMFKAWVACIISKNPKYKFLRATRSSWSGKKLTFWFMNTVNNIQVLYSKDEIVNIYKSTPKSCSPNEEEQKAIAWKSICQE